MEQKGKVRLWSSLARGLLIVSTLFFLFVLLQYPAFRRQGDGLLEFLQFLFVISLIPVFLFSLGMICKNKAFDLREAEDQVE